MDEKTYRLVRSSIRAQRRISRKLNAHIAELGKLPNGAQAQHEAMQLYQQLQHENQHVIIDGVGLVVEIKESEDVGVKDPASDTATIEAKSDPVSE